MGFELARSLHGIYFEWIFSSPKCLCRFTNFKTQGIRFADGKSNPHYAWTDHNLWELAWPWFLFSRGFTSPRIQVNARRTDRKTCCFGTPFSEAMIFCVFWTQIMHTWPLGKSNLSARTLTPPFFLQQDGAQWFVLLPSCVCVEGLTLGSTEAKKRKQKTTCLWFLEISKQNLAIRLSKGPGNLFQIQSPPNKWARTNTEIVDYVDFLLAWNNDTRATQTRQTKSKQMGFLISRSWALRARKSKEQDHLFCIFSR